MKQSLFLFILSAFLIASTLSISAQQPQLIDRDVFFGNPELSGSQISPDGKWISFMKPYKNTRNVWVKRAEDSFDKAKLVTAETKRAVGGYFWSHDSKYILFVKDNGGDENFNVYSVNPNDKPVADSPVPPARNITEGKKVRAAIQSLPKSDPDTIFVGLNDRDPAWHDIYKVSISTGEKTLVMENKNRLQGLIFDNADKIRLSIRSAKNGDTEVLSLDSEQPKVIYSCNVFETCGPVRFHKDNKRVYFRTNKGARDLSQLVLLNVETGKETFVEQDPKGRVDLGGVIFSEVSNSIIATTYNDDKTHIYWKNKEIERDYKWLQKKLPGKEINFSSSTKDERIFKIDASSDTDPGSVYFFDRRKKKLTLQYQIRKRLPRESLAKMTPIRYKSSDGLEIPAYLTLPKGVAAKNLPLVVNPHGGPWARDGWGYSTFAQFLANRGYAVLQMNFRGSTGYGKKFLDAGNKQWGDLMQDDITWGVKHLVDKGIVDSKRVGIMGGSYGGYATLAGVTYTPDTYAAAVAIVAPSNLITLLDAIPPYWEPIRKMFYLRMGDPNTVEGKKELMRQSPLTHADKIKTPLMVVQGANDPRVNKRESDQIVIALRDRNYPVEYIVAPDEGHGFRRPVNNIAMLAAAEKFLAKHLGGRYQAEMPENIAKRLGEITVDPKDVTLPKKVDMSKSASVNVSGTWNLDADAGGQQVELTLVLEQKGNSFDGTVSTAFGDGIVEDGKISGSDFEGTIKIEIQGQPMELKLKGAIADGKMLGSIEGPGIPEVSFSGSKK